MRRFLVFILVLLPFIGHSQISKILGKWNTLDDRTGEMRSCVLIYEQDGKYYGKVDMLYEKDGNGGYKVMQEPYAKEYQGVVGTIVLLGLEPKGDVLKGKLYDPEGQKEYYGKVSYNAKTGELDVRGSLDRLGALGRTQHWVRKK